MNRKTELKNALTNSMYEIKRTKIVIELTLLAFQIGFIVGCCQKKVNYID